MGGRSAAAVTLHSRGEMLNVSPHQYPAPMACLSTGGGDAASGSCGRNCTGVWIGAEAGGGEGVILSLSYCHACNVALARSMLEKASTASACADVWSWSQCKSGITLPSRPKDTALAAIRFHALIGVKKGDLDNRCTSASGVIVILATATASDAAVPTGSLGVPSPVVARSESSSAMVGVATSCIVCRLALNSTFVGRIPRRMSRAKARTFPILQMGSHSAPPRGPVCVALESTGR